MEVTNKNFEEALEKIKETLKNADFISIDGEFTGLGRPIGEKYNELDTPEERYQKVKNIVREYGLIQFGMTIFRFCSENKRFLSSTFCFFLSGNPSGSYRYDSSSMTFLAENDFDFNKLFLEGLPFLSLLDEVSAREKRIKKLSEEKCIVSPVNVKDEASRKFVESATDKISKLNSLSSSCVFPFSSMTGFHRKILYSNISPKFPNCRLKNNKTRDLEVIYYESEEEKLKEEDRDWETGLDSKIGFCHVVKEILKANIPLVGHNMFLDVLHVTDKFLAPLPDTFEELKSLVQENLPPIYDTKLIAKDPPFSANIMNTALGVLYDELTTHYSPPEFQTIENHLSYTIKDEGQAHDAGYDAFMTGICFATMVKHFETSKWNEISSPLKSKHLEQYVNKINFMASYDLPFIDMHNKQAIPDRSNVYCVDCPSTFTQLNARNLFKRLKSYKTVWVNDSFLYVIAQDENDIAQSKSLLEDFKVSAADNVFVSLYKNVSSTTSSSNNGKVIDPKVPTPVKANSAKDKEMVNRNLPKSINLKRKSNNLDTSSSASDTSHNLEGKMLKRLKSVGSEQLSNLTLESPTDEGVKVMTDSLKDKPVKSTGTTGQDFDVPEQW